MSRRTRGPGAGSDLVWLSIGTLAPSASRPQPVTKRLIQHVLEGPALERSLAPGLVLQLLVDRHRDQHLAWSLRCRHTSPLCETPAAFKGSLARQAN